jgi:protein-S-isoprenylcysteine O-methyltransferase Ste14
MDPMNGERIESVERDRPGVIALPPLIYAAGLTVGLSLQWLFPLGAAFGIAWKLFGGALMAAALTVILWAERTMKRAGTNVNPMKPAVAVVTDGPYRFMRNPMYLSLTLFYSGLSLALGALWPLLLLPGVLAVMHYGVILREEGYLERRFGEVYLQYKAQVRRWL